MTILKIQLRKIAYYSVGWQYTLQSKSIYNLLDLVPKVIYILRATDAAGCREMVDLDQPRPAACVDHKQA